MTTAIRDDIRKAAEQIWQEAYIGTATDQHIDVIAHALLEAEQRATERERRKERKRCAAIARERAEICQDACDRIKAKTLYKDIPTAFQTENCARLEALHIAELIENESISPKKRRAKQARTGK